MKKKEKDMKKFLMFLCGIFICVICFADTINLTWKVDNALYDTSTCTTGGDLILPTTPTKYGYTFTGWEFAKMQPVEYLESTGTQWIDTGFIPNSNTKVEISVMSNLDTINSLFGARSKSAAPNRFEYVMWLNTTMSSSAMGYASRFDYSGTGLANVISGQKVVQISNPVIFVKDKEKNYINGIAQTSNASANFSCGYNAYLFAINQANSAIYPGTMKIYYAKIWDNDILVRDFIPVLDPSGTPCMYDKVTEQYFYNSGTGDFIAGPVLNE